MLRQWRLLLRAQHLIAGSPAGAQLQCNIQPCRLFGRHAPVDNTASVLLAVHGQLDLGQQQTCRQALKSRLYSSSRQLASEQPQQAPAVQPAAGSSSSSSSSSQQTQGQTLLQPQQDISVPSARDSPQQPLAAVYGARRVTAKQKAAGVQKREGIVHVNSTLNNTIMVLTDRDHKVQTWTSGGTVGYKNANKATPMAAELAAKELAKKAVSMGFHSVVVKLKGMGKNKQFAVQSLAANGLTVTQLWDVTPIPYNGCRLPRRRRV